MEEHEKDENIVWKASIMHHLMFGLHYNDYGSILDNFLPLLRKYKYDIFLNGHEHQMNYAYTSQLEYDQNFDEVDFETDLHVKTHLRNMLKHKCYDKVEIFP